jgi:uncharacterized delta-60 repeat protein
MERNMTITLDNTFGGDGIVTTDFSDNSDLGHSVTVQSDDKILVAGYTTNNGYYDLALVRYNTDGSLDNSFDGDGKITTDFFGSYDMGNSVTVQNDDKILVAGFTNNNGDYDFALVRYNEDGSLDNSFDGDGKVTTDFFGSYDYAHSITLQSDGKILVAGFTNNNGDYDFALVRYNADGSLDNSFDGDGKVTTDFFGDDDTGNSVTVQSDGKIIVAGGTGNGFGLVRYNADGSLDNSFDGDGKVTTDFSIGSSNLDAGRSVTVQNDGKILCSGSIGNNIQLARYNGDGSLDNSFDGDGKVTTILVSGGGSFQNYSSMAVQNDGKILSTVGNILVRYDTDGSLDNSFGTDGIYSLPTSFASNAISLQSDVKIIVAGFDYSYDVDFSAVRLNNNVGTENNVATEGPDILIGTAGADTINGLAGNDTISGLASNDRLLGSGGDDSINGGAGDDTMIGGPGNDTYIVNSVRDRVIEALNAGTDRIFSTATYTLPANVENLTLQGTQAINGTGNGLVNRIIGNSAANRINGGGGNDILNGGGGNDVFLVNPGNDRLTGGTGADRFIYNTNATFTRTAVGVDTITDFIISQNDKIVLDKTTFPKITSANGTGFSRDAEFAKVSSNTTAAISGADIVYNTATGELFYNQNGTATGFGTGGKFAVLSNKPNLTENQFIIQA